MVCHLLLFAKVGQTSYHLMKNENQILRQVAGNQILWFCLYNWIYFKLNFKSICLTSAEWFISYITIINTWKCLSSNAKHFHLINIFMFILKWFKVKQNWIVTKYRLVCQLFKCWVTFLIESQSWTLVMFILKRYNFTTNQGLIIICSCFWSTLLLLQYKLKWFLLGVKKNFCYFSSWITQKVGNWLSSNLHSE